MGRSWDGEAASVTRSLACSCSSRDAAPDRWCGLGMITSSLSPLLSFPGNGNFLWSLDVEEGQDKLIQSAGEWSDRSETFPGGVWLLSPLCSLLSP